MDGLFYTSAVIDSKPRIGKSEIRFSFPQCVYYLFDNLAYMCCFTPAYFSEIVVFCRVEAFCMYIDWELLMLQSGSCARAGLWLRNNKK